MTRARLKRGRTAWPFVVPPNVRVVRSGAREYYYFRRGSGPSERLAGEPIGKDGLPNPDWWTHYRALLGPTDRDYTVAELATFYVGSTQWRALAPRSKEGLRQPLLWLATRWRNRRASRLRAEQLFALRDAMARTPGTANVTLRALSAMLSWAVANGYLERNPCLGHSELLYRIGRAYGAWSEEDIALFHQVAAPELRRVAALILATAQRLEAVLALTWQDVQADILTVAGAGQEPPLRFLLQGDLAAAIADLPRNGDRLLTDSRGRAWSPWGLRDAWRVQMRNPRLSHLRRQHCAVCGLRKTAIVRMVAAGCTRMEVTAVTGLTWETVEPYFAHERQREHAASAIAKWEAQTQRGAQT